MWRKRATNLDPKFTQNVQRNVERNCPKNAQEAATGIHQRTKERNAQRIQDIIS
jgi:hypothetical protein